MHALLTSFNKISLELKISKFQDGGLDWNATF